MKQLGSVTLPDSKAARTLERVVNAAMGLPCGAKEFQLAVVCMGLVRRLSTGDGPKAKILAAAGLTPTSKQLVTL